MLFPVSLALLASAPVSNGASLAAVSQLLETYDDSLTSYLASRTNVGDLRPLVAQRYDWLDSTFDNTEFGETDDNLKPYAATYLAYDSSRRVNSAWFNGQCGCSGGSNGTYSYTFDNNGSYSDTTGYTTTWATRTVVVKPDGSNLTQYFDELGQGLSSAVTDFTASASGPAPSAWVTNIVRDANGCTTEVHMPDNVTAYTHNSGGNPSGAITTSLTTGLVYVYTRSLSGDLTGFVTEHKFKKGSEIAANGNSIFYAGKTVWNATTLTKTITNVKVVRPLVSAVRKYPAQGTTDTAYEETAYGYTGYSSTLMPEAVTTTLPVVSTGNNGSNSANVRSTHFRRDGLVDFVKNEDATIDYFA